LYDYDGEDEEAPLNTSFANFRWDYMNMFAQTLDEIAARESSRTFQVMS